MGHHDWVFHTWLHTGKNSMYQAKSNSSCLLKFVFVPLFLYLESCQTSKMGRFAKIVAVNYFHKMLHLRCLKGFWKRLWHSRVQNPTKHLWLISMILYKKFIIDQKLEWPQDCLNREPVTYKGLMPFLSFNDL